MPRVTTSGPIVFRPLKSGGYELVRRWVVDTGIVDSAARILGYVTLEQGGMMTIEPGYKWDGASGPVVNRRTNMRASLAHDALYQLLRASKLHPSYRDHADRLYVDLYKQDGGWGWVGWLDYAGMRLFAGFAARPQPEAEVRILSAP